MLLMASHRAVRAGWTVIMISTDVMLKLLLDVNAFHVEQNVSPSLYWDRIVVLPKTTDYRLTFLYLLLPLATTAPSVIIVTVANFEIPTLASTQRQQMLHHFTIATTRPIITFSYANHLLGVLT